MSPFQKWYTKAGTVFFLCASSETFQCFGVFDLVRVFVPLNIAMYALGVVFAALAD